MNKPVLQEIYKSATAHIAAFRRVFYGSAHQRRKQIAVTEIRMLFDDILHIFYS